MLVFFQLKLACIVFNFRLIQSSLPPSNQGKYICNLFEWVTKWKHLGVTLLQSRLFNCCVDETLSKFYRAANSILRVDGRSDDVTMLRLLETHCVSVLSYAIDVIHISDRRMKSKMRVAYNSIFRKLFNYTWRESVTELQHALGRPTWEELITKREQNFLNKCRSMSSDSLVRVLSLR